jgi:hypothetical protein
MAAPEKLAEHAELLPLSSAALTAYYNIAGGARSVTDTAVLQRRLDAVATAIASIVPIYTKETPDAPLRPLTKIELALADFCGGGATLVHRDRDRTHTDLRVEPRDLLEAIHVLQELHRPVSS